MIWFLQWPQRMLRWHQPNAFVWTQMQWTGMIFSDMYTGADELAFTTNSESTNSQMPSPGRKYPTSYLDSLQSSVALHAVSNHSTLNSIYIYLYIKFRKLHVETATDCACICDSDKCRPRNLLAPWKVCTQVSPWKPQIPSREASVNQVQN